MKTLRRVIGMKTLIAMIAVLAVSNAFASDYQDAAERAFDSMTATQAWSSNKFKKQVPNIAMPGSSSFIKATGLCISGSDMMTKGAVSGACTSWTYRNNDGDRKTTTNAALASRKDAKCVARSSRVLSHPINYTAEVKVWGVKDEDGKVKTYTSYSRATEKGAPFVVSTKSVAKRIPTTFTVKFYRATAQNRFDRSKLVGSHRFSIGSCN